MRVLSSGLSLGATLYRLDQRWNRADRLRGDACGCSWIVVHGVPGLLPASSEVAERLTVVIARDEACVVVLVDRPRRLKAAAHQDLRSTTTTLSRRSRSSGTTTAKPDGHTRRKRRSATVFTSNPFDVR